LICTDVCRLFQYLLNNETKDQERLHIISDIETKLKDVRKLIEKIKASFEQKIDLDKLLEIELREMDAAIDDAASKITDLLAKAREKDNKTNLEVNGKIVDACTTLMECVKALIQKSRLLQHEIVASQKGIYKIIYEYSQKLTNWILIFQEMPVPMSSIGEIVSGRMA